MTSRLRNALGIWHELDEEKKYDDFYDLKLDRDKKYDDFYDDELDAVKKYSDEVWPGEACVAVMATSLLSVTDRCPWRKALYWSG